MPWVDAMPVVGPLDEWEIPEIEHQPLVVCRGGDANEACCPDDRRRCFGTVTAAVEAAVSGGTIYVGPGVFDGAVTVRGETLKALTIIGSGESRLEVEERTGDSSNVVSVSGGARLTLRNLIVSSGESRALEVDGATLVVEDSSIEGDLFTYGGAVRAHPGSRLVMERTDILGGQAVYGGQIYAKSSNVMLRDCILGEGIATDGGGAIAIVSDPDEPGQRSRLTLQNTIIYQASAYGHGGGIFADGPVSVVVDQASHLARNVALGSGGAISLGAESEATVQDSTLVDNEAIGRGGAIHVHGEAALLLNRTRFERNRSSSNSGGAVWWAGDGATDVVWSNLWFLENSAHDAGGAVLLGTPGRRVTITNSGFLGNGAIEGGALAIGPDVKLRLVDSVIAWTRSGGGLAIDAVDKLACRGLWYDNEGGHVLPSTAPCLNDPGNRVDVDPLFYAYSADKDELNDDLGFNPLISPLARSGLGGGNMGPSGSNADRDGDEWTDQYDCNDADDTIHPEASDVPEDGLDSNCDGSDGVDIDRDGHQLPADCNDHDPTIHPRAVEDADLSVDRDCDGFDAPTRGVRPAGCRTDGPSSLFPSFAAALGLLGWRRRRR